MTIRKSGTREDTPELVAARAALLKREQAALDDLDDESDSTDEDED